jgi:DNA (cytosine-5)-methyltransferase 1
MKKRLLDLCCCAGGASKGYHDAGFQVVGVDIKPQPNYPYEFIQADILEVMKDDVFMARFDAIHASPPCQGYSHATKDNSVYVPYSQGKQTPRLIEPVRLLMPKGKLYVIENVAGARHELLNPFALTGFMFGLPIERKRYFESNLLISTPQVETKRGFTKRYAAEHGIDYRDMSVTGKSRRTGSIDTWRSIMQMPWAGRAWELSEAIPPAYTKFIGEQLMKQLNLRDKQ